MKILPRLMLVTQRSLMRPNFSDALSAALDGGARLVQLREKDISHPELFDLARAAKTICDAHGAQLVVNGSMEIARAIGAHLHLPEAASVADARRALGREYSLGQSVHSLAAAQRAQNEGADYLVFGSVFPTASHPGSTPGGIEALRQVAQELEIPIFAIGGVTPVNCADCLAAGAHGVAVMRAVWHAPDMAAAVADFNALLTN